MKGESEIDDANVVVCALASDPTPFTDNDLGSCIFCERLVMHRPHVPMPCALVCRICFVERAEEGDEVQITKETALEAVMVIGKEVDS